jgi:hypothetical protein
VSDLLSCPPCLRRHSHLFLLLRARLNFSCDGSHLSTAAAAKLDLAAYGLSSGHALALGAYLRGVSSDLTAPPQLTPALNPAPPQTIDH